MRRVLAILVMTAAAVALAAPAVEAASWGPISSSYNGSTVVSGSGTFSVGSSYANASLSVTDSKNDGNAVYGKIRFQYYYFNVAQGANVWSTWSTQGTGQFSNKTVKVYPSAQIPMASKDERGRPQVCAQMGFPVPDSCASTTVNP